MPFMAAAAAFLGSASEKITIGFLPRLTRLRSAAASLAMALPLGTDPTKPMRRTSGCRTRAEPVLPSPASILITPPGNMPSHNSPSHKLDSGAWLRSLDDDGIAGGEWRRGLSAQKRNGWSQRKPPQHERRVRRVVDGGNCGAWFSGMHVRRVRYATPFSAKSKMS